MTDLNWFGIAFAILLPIGVIAGMITVLIRDSRKARRRARRLHRPIDSWHELRVD